MRAVFARQWAKGVAFEASKRSSAAWILEGENRVNAQAQPAESREPARAAPTVGDIAISRCTICNHPIGFSRGFYDAGDRYVHADCAERQHQESLEAAGDAYDDALWNQRWTIVEQVDD